MQCPHCGADAPENVHFCEECGARLDKPDQEAVAVAVAVSVPISTLAGACRCGAGPEEVDAQGFCTGCGRQRKAASRDHVEVALAPHFAGVTDRGIRHPRNEDDMALALETLANDMAHILVVSDGVSSSHNADAASEAASTHARERLAQAILQSEADLEAAMAEAIRAAHDAVCKVPYTPGGDKDPPAATIVAALVRGETAILGWVGDSRAYCFTHQEAMLLTHDHSWVNEMVDSGQLTEDEAMLAPEAHAITQCLGILEGEDPSDAPTPGIKTVTLPTACRLIVCSDGLWNYASHPEQLAEQIRQAPPQADALTLARHLTSYAIAQGGKDNITVSVLHRMPAQEQKETKENSNAV